MLVPCALSVCACIFGVQDSNLLQQFADMLQQITAML